jgi:hypothetical protein
MKSNGTRLLIILVFVQLLILIATVAVQAQPDYVFRSHTLESGTALQQGAVYRFKDVKPGIDGLMTIEAFSGGMTLSELDGASGFDEAFQPYVNCEPRKQGSVQFLLQFVRSGTNIPVVQYEVPLTAIDIDGWEFPDDKLYETDEFEKSPSYYVDYDNMGSSLDITETASWFRISNRSAITYDGIDTAQRDVMFTMVHANVSSVRFKVGANNRSANFMMRLRSVYFKRFFFTNSFLAKSPLLSFRGFEKNKKVELNWELENNNHLQTIIIEKSTTGNFTTIGQVLLYNETQQSGKFKFTDENMLSGTSLYRLKMIAANGTITYSNTLSFRTTGMDSKKFSVYPTAVTNNATLSIQANANGVANFELVDYSGRIVHRQLMTVQSGNNNIQVNNFGNLTGGQYIAVIKIDNSIYSQKIFKQ